MRGALEVIWFLICCLISILGLSFVLHNAFKPSDWPILDVMFYMLIIVWVGYMLAGGLAFSNKGIFKFTGRLILGAVFIGLVLLGVYYFLAEDDNWHSTPYLISMIIIITPLIISFMPSQENKQVRLKAKNKPDV